jgi:2-amino-4-hydroxy-6-hydroxymethyldihydropteridine diphosphokinase
MSEQEKAYIGLGSNLEHPQQQIQKALTLLAHSPHIQISQTSQLYRSPALLPEERSDEIQPEYINAVVAVTTQLSAPQLLQYCHEIEKNLGRQRSGQRWQARIIDLDLLWFYGKKLTTASLTLPHPEITQRLFVLEPLAEIAANLPLWAGETVHSALKKNKPRLLAQGQAIIALDS